MSSSTRCKFRKICVHLMEQKWFDRTTLAFIGLNCVTLAMERPNIPPNSKERLFLTTTNYIFTVVFALEMLVKVVGSGLWYGKHTYFRSGWNVIDGTLIIISLVDGIMNFFSTSSSRIFGILQVFRLLRSLRPLRVINRAPGLKLVVQTLLTSLRSIGNIVLICCTFFIIFGILGVQLFKGTFYYCEGPDMKSIKNRTDCEADSRNQWLNRKYNFDDLGQALLALFVLFSKDGWVDIMYQGLDAVGVDQQPIANYSKWCLLYFISFLLLVGFFVLNMFIGVVVENFHRCREEQEKEERTRRVEKEARKLEKERPRMCTSKGIRALLDTVMQALMQVGNLGLLFYLLFFIFAVLGVELFGKLEHPCQGLGEHAHFANFGMAFLTLFRVATGDNWHGIMKDNLRDNCDPNADCACNCCISPIIAPLYFVVFVLMSQFVLVNIVVAVLVNTWKNYTNKWMMKSNRN